MRREIALLRADGLGPGRFALFLDEADALQVAPDPPLPPPPPPRRPAGAEPGVNPRRNPQRTDGETEAPLLLEERLSDLCGGAQDADGRWRLSDGGSFAGPQLVRARAGGGKAGTNPAQNPAQTPPCKTRHDPRRRWWPSPRRCCRCF